MTSAVVFAYSEVGARCLQVLLSRSVTIPVLFTHADDDGETQWFASVARLAAERGIRVEQPDDPNSNEWLALAREQTHLLTGAAAPDFVFSFYYRRMLAADWLDLPTLGALNMHGSLLPTYRGRAPVHWAILNGEPHTGASLHYMLGKPDAGAVVEAEPVPIGENDDALRVSRAVAEAAARVLDRALPRLIDGTAAARELDLRAGSYFGRRTPEDGRIDWRWSARKIHDLVRAVAPPFPGAFFELRGARVFVHETRVDTGPRRYPDRAPCLYHESGEWFADCIDTHRLRLTRLQWRGQPLSLEQMPEAWPHLSVGGYISLVTEIPA